MKLLEHINHEIENRETLIMCNVYDEDNAPNGNYYTYRKELMDLIRERDSLKAMFEGLKNIKRITPTIEVKYSDDPQTQLGMEKLKVLEDLEAKHDIDFLNIDWEKFKLFNPTKYELIIEWAAIRPYDSFCPENKVFTYNRSTTNLLNWIQNNSYWLKTRKILRFVASRGNEQIVNMESVTYTDLRKTVKQILNE